MANANVLELMERFDFKEPVKITLLFEDSDDDVEIVNENNQKVQSDNNSNEEDNTTFEESSETENIPSKTESQQKGKESNESLLKQILTDTTNNLMNKESCIDNQFNANKLDRSFPNGVIDNPGNILHEPRPEHEISTKASHEQPPTATIEAQSVSNQAESYVTHYQGREPVSLLDDLLNTLSEHLIIVMHSYFRYRIHRTGGDDYPQREKVYRLIKHHFFEISYHTTVSVIIPQEHNKRFTNTFLENTVTIANTKSKVWKCHRGHLEPIFIELLRWVKNKKSMIDRVSSHFNVDKDYFLKQRLNAPSISPPFLETPTRRQFVSNDVCIFSSGNSGVKINITRDSLINRNIIQYSSTIDRQDIQNQNPRYKSCQTGSENRIVPQACDNHINTYTKNYNSKLHRRLSPYSVIQRSINNESPNLISAIQSSQNIEKLRHESQTRSPPHTISPPTSGLINVVNENIDCQNMLRLNSHVENGENARTLPLITDVISLYPKGQNTTGGRCCVCGKKTHITCSKCNSPSYCSHLCQVIC
ncbi:unnamed protein product [Chrysodeixis includens]|uniref:Uncharacterized protein n=1 Tax=Chrysodeixis includens TaxID=689277 RepID=A0A9P0BPL0_CHRIL|nr:unnamed protein product [Chrysodeixis includens]